ncbi:MAG TPA: hypothetical protein VIY86_04645, partial [Pirellulaceae bacterium]
EPAGVANPSAGSPSGSDLTASLFPQDVYTAERQALEEFVRQLEIALHQSPAPWDGSTISAEFARIEAEVQRLEAQTRSGNTSENRGKE